MLGAIHHLPSTQSPLGRLDSRWRLAALVLAALTIPFLTSPGAALVLLGEATLLGVLTSLPLRWSLARLGTALLVLIPFVIMLLLLPAEDGATLSIGPLHVAENGARAAVVLVCKTLALVLFVLIALTAAPLHLTFKAAQSLHVPGLLIQLVSLTHRYVFVLAGEMKRLRVAMRMRGYRHRARLHCYRTIGHVTGTLLVRGYEQAERVEQAMRCRGFDGQFRSLGDFRTRAIDVLAFTAIVGFAALVLCFNIWAFQRPH